MCLWAHCLDQLPQEVPYSLKFAIDGCERAKFDGEGDDRIYVHARIRCRSERVLVSLHTQIFDSRNII